MRLVNVRFLCKKRRLLWLLGLSVSFLVFFCFVTLTLDEQFTLHRPITRSNDTRIYTKLRVNISCPAKISLLILVSSNLENFDRRNLIRNTWGSDNSVILQRWRTVFLLTDDENEKNRRIAEKESVFYGDVISGSYKESFFNMAFKVAMGFEWSLKFCKFDFLLKTDDDIFVNTHSLLGYLNDASTPKKKLYTGNPMIGSPVLRSGRYAVQYETAKEKRDDQMNKTIFAPYCSGGGFLLSADVVGTMFELYDLEHPLNIDDAYMGELAERANIKMIVNGKNFKMYADSCKYDTDAFVQHPAKGNCLKDLHKTHVNYMLTGELETPLPPTQTPTPPLDNSIPGNRTRADTSSGIPGNRTRLDSPSGIPENKM